MKATSHRHVLVECRELFHSLCEPTVYVIVAAFVITNLVIVDNEWHSVMLIEGCGPSVFTCVHSLGSALNGVVELWGCGPFGLHARPRASTHPRCVVAAVVAPSRSGFLGFWVSGFLGFWPRRAEVGADPARERPQHDATAFSPAASLKLAMDGARGRARARDVPRTRGWAAVRVVVVCRAVATLIHTHTKSSGRCATTVMAVGGIAAGLPRIAAYRVCV